MATGPFRATTYAEDTMIDALQKHGWIEDDGGWRAPDGYGLLATFTMMTAFDIEVHMGEDRRRFPRPRPGLDKRLRFWWFGWKLHRALKRERIALLRAARPRTELDEGLRDLWAMLLIGFIIACAWCLAR